LSTISQTTSALTLKAHLTSRLDCQLRANSGLCRQNWTACSMRVRFVAARRYRGWRVLTTAAKRM